MPFIVSRKLDRYFVLSLPLTRTAILRSSSVISAVALPLGYFSTAPLRRFILRIGKTGLIGQCDCRISVGLRRVSFVP